MDNGDEKLQMLSINESDKSKPYEVLLLVLPYLPLHDLLSVSQASILLRQTLKEEIQLWSNIIVDQPLSSRLSDSILFKITSNANGNLKSLVLINCTRITDHGLQAVVRNNLLIDKLCIPRCTALSPNGVIEAVKLLAHNNQRPKTIQINGTYNWTKQHLQTLQQCLPNNPSLNHPLLYHNYITHPTNNQKQTDHTIDLEICPKCDEVKMVFDCPKETCKRKPGMRTCKGCFFCIPRCAECGGCIESEEEQEDAVVCMDVLCSTCWLQLPKCDLCNKAYCKRHAHLGYSSITSSSGFVCDVCQSKF